MFTHWHFPRSAVLSGESNPRHSLGSHFPRCFACHAQLESATLWHQRRSCCQSLAASAYAKRFSLFALVPATFAGLSRDLTGPSGPPKMCNRHHQQIPKAAQLARLIQETLFGCSGLQFPSVPALFLPNKWASLACYPALPPLHPPRLTDLNASTLCSESHLKEDSAGGARLWLDVAQVQTRNNLWEKKKRQRTKTKEVQAKYCRPSHRCGPSSPLISPFIWFFFYCCSWSKRLSGLFPDISLL